MKNIPVATDSSDCARRAEETAMALGRGLGAELVLLHVSVETPLYNEGMPVADRIVRFAPCPVVTVRLPSKEARP
jgi:nucleotide-binding universal stress UspA family protein